MPVRNLFKIDKLLQKNGVIFSFICDKCIKNRIAFFDEMLYNYDVVSDRDTKSFLL